ncbi:hypothetical protein [Planobispora takensis]|uniref:Uncharacterized protein n=1 Tax=Planobispora takensis TaxID=1367882 RepID=A0A8J3T088_9ACTN|nr:hypothetical protein [Planobispora takensis]GII02056.1 hypothetical protein Pta02_40640 [Planobispora takensis]
MILLLIPDIVVIGTHILDARVFGASAGVRLAVLLALLLVVSLAVFRTQSSFSLNWFRQVGLQIIRLLFTISMIAIVVLPLLLVIGQASQSPYAATGIVASVALAILLLFGCLVHANKTSLHSLYSRRLSRAYVVRAPGKGEQAVGLSEVGLHDTCAEDLPALLVCAAVNLREIESAQGEGCASFVFSADYVGSAGLVEAEAKQFNAVNTVADLVAASGAAIAPNMGRYTSRASRLALALMNLRLGLWLQNPLSPSSPRRRLLPRWLVTGWRQPGPLFTWREAFGELSLGHTFVFVSDGGHWDNSGVVELLRRRCRTIFAVDASVDEARVGNLLRLISLARTELGVEFDSDGRLLESRAPVERVRFAYPDDDETSPAGYLILLRTHVSPEMPSDLVALATDRSAFPRHSTLNQFLCARDVDAYIAFGRWLFQSGLVAADLLPPRCDAVRVRVRS